MGIGLAKWEGEEPRWVACTEDREIRTLSWRSEPIGLSEQMLAENQAPEQRAELMSAAMEAARRSLVAMVERELGPCEWTTYPPSYPCT
jgi:hypothetical protein